MMKPNLLLVGEGDFSFAAAEAIKGTHTVIATALLLDRPPTENQLKNINLINEHGGHVILDVDATRLSEHPKISSMLLNKIQFNFPHVGGKMNIKENRKLVGEFFKSCNKLFQMGCFDPEEGEVWVSLCSGQGGTPVDTKQRKWHDTWQVVPLAATANFVLINVVPFEVSKFPGYICTGYRGLDKSFLVEGSLVHIFQHEPAFSCQVQLPFYSSIQTVHIQGKHFEVPFFYAQFLERNLLEEEDSPVNRLFCCAKRYLSDFNVHEINCNRFPVLKFEESLCIFAHKEVQVSLQEDKNKWILTPSIISVLDFEKLLSVKGLFCYSSQSFLETKICRHISPIQHQLWVSWQYFPSFCPKSFLHTLNPHLNIFPVIVGKEFEHNIEDDHFYLIIKQFLKYFQNTIISVIQSSALDEVKQNDWYTQCVGVIFKIIGPQCETNHMCISLDKIAMVKFEMKDWRMMWTRNGSYYASETKNCDNLVEYIFRPKSLFPTSFVQDTSFWLAANNSFNENKMIQLLRCAVGRGLERVSLLEEYNCPKNGMKSLCYRIVYRSWEGSLSKELCNGIHSKVREMLSKIFMVVLR